MPGHSGKAFLDAGILTATQSLEIVIHYPCHPAQPSVPFVPILLHMVYRKRWYPIMVQFFVFTNTEFRDLLKRN